MEDELSYLRQEVERLKSLQPIPKHVCENPECKTVTDNSFCKKHKPTCTYLGCTRACYKEKCCHHSDTALAYNREKARLYRERVKRQKTQVIV